MRDVRFARVLFFTKAVPSDVVVPDTIEVRKIEGIDSYHEYSVFMLKRFVEHIDSEYVLVTQWDGYVAHASEWNPAFLNCDYLGAVWPAAVPDEKGSVGNGGFSLRSHKLLNALQDRRIVPTGHEDQTICGAFKPLLEQEYGIRFGSMELADRFSFEMNQSLAKAGVRTFGFHGLFNFFLIEPESELIALAEELPDDALRSLTCRQLFGNCYNFKQWRAAIALGRRILEADPDNFKVAEMIVNAQTMLNSPSRTGAASEGSRKGLARLFHRAFGRR